MWQLIYVRRHYDSDSWKIKTASAAMNLHASQPPEERQRLLSTSAMTTASPEEPSTCDESFASDDSIASAEHNKKLTEEEVLKYALRKEEYLARHMQQRMKRRGSPWT